MFVVESGQDLIVRLQPGEDFFESLSSLHLTAGVLVGGIGMLRDVTLAFWTGKNTKSTKSPGRRSCCRFRGIFL
jgi:predicted DNA-binding protein with PD1-like motif